MLNSEKLKFARSPSLDLCIFCYKCAATTHSYQNTGNTEFREEKENYKSDNDKKSSENVPNVLDNFLKYLGRFIGQDIERDECNRFLGCCEDCGSIISSFCKLFHDLKCLELQLEWRLGTLVNIMKFANRVPSRLQQLKKSFETERNDGDEDREKQEERRTQRLKKFQKYRNNLVKKCSLRLSKSLPRVSVKCWKKVTPDQGVIVAQTGSLSPKPSLTLEQEYNSSELPSSSYNGMEKSARIFVRWMISFSAVAALLLSPKKEETIESVPSVLKVDVGVDPVFAIKEYNQDICDPVKVECGVIIPNDHLDATEFSSGIVEPEESEMKIEPQLASELEESEHIFVKVEESSFVPEVQENEEEQELFPEDLSNDENDDFFSDEMDATEYTICDSEGIQVALENSELASPDLMTIALPEEKAEEDNETESRPLVEGFEFVVIPTPSIAPPKNQIQSESTFPRPQKQQRYSLRENRQSLYSKMQVDDDEDNDLSDHTYYNPADHEDGSSSMESDNESIHDPIPRRRGRPRKRVPIKEKISTSNIENNIWSSKPSAQPEYLLCNLDGCTFKLRSDNKINRRQFQEHQKLHAHGNYNCNHCDITEDTMIKLMAHESAQHLSAINHQKSEAAKDEAQGRASLRSDYYCPRCPFESKNMNEYRKHFTEVHCNSKKDDISTSDSEPEPSTSFQSKSVEDSSTKLPCPMDNCPHKFRTKLALAKHTKLHRKFLCKFCNIVIKYAPELPLHESSKHVFVRSSNKNTSPIYHCSRCPSHFSKKSEYLRHFFKTHLREKVPSDTTSSTTATAPVSPVPVNMTPTPTPPFLRSITCHVCQKRDNSPNFLQTHFLSHHNTEGLDQSEIYKCSQCPAYFIKEEQLLKHKTRTQHFDNEINQKSDISTPTKPQVLDLLENVCFLCGEMYATQEEMEEHLKNMHVDDDEESKNYELALSVL